ncbi:uncharacterized protein LOC117540122 [Gymnodraco acuticeps]|uniref:Uncharacterized protein LOC117540122 n=1 Tax=Gymnodraco acuticeps TaxID=8218 RepID=A0A6P8TF32_GYMAC|nr:uncharacterized protein LOC117540122 [Gymnodraco acuticeps]
MLRFHYSLGTGVVTIVTQCRRGDQLFGGRSDAAYNCRDVIFNATQLTKHTTTMEDVEAIVSLLLGMWFFITARRKTLFRKRLLIARRNTEEAEGRLMAIVQRGRDYSRTTQRQRYSKLGCHRRPCVWMLDRATEWWGVIVPSFTHTQWVENFRMSEETYVYLCNKLRPAMERQDTPFRECIPLKKRVAIALWKLATGSEFDALPE